MKMYVISDNADTYMGFRLAGVEGVVVHKEPEVLAAIEAVLADPTVGIVLITEKLSALCPAKVEELRSQYTQPLVVEIPDRHGSGRDHNAISQYIQEAIGLKI